MREVSRAQQITDRRCMIRSRWECRVDFGNVIRGDYLIAVGRRLPLWVVCSRSEQREGLNPVPIFARFEEARRRRILPLELVTLTYALFRLFWGSLRHPLFPPESARASASAGAVSHGLGVIDTGSAFPVTHRIELSSNPAIQP